MNKILVTGSSGQLGREIVKQLREKSYPVIGIDITKSETTDQLIDIRDKAQIFAITQSVDAIIHTAAIHGKHFALNYPREAFTSTNIDGTLNLLNACVEHGIKKFLYTSTTSLYGHAMVNPREAVWVDEELLPDPRDIYDITKLTAELLCRDFFEKEGIQTTVLRVSRFLPEPANTVAIHRMYRGLDERDGAAAHLLALEKSFDQFEVFMISAKSPFQKSDLKQLKEEPKQVIQRYYPRIETLFEERKWVFPKTIDRVYVIGKARRLLGYEPRHNFEACLANTEEEKRPLTPNTLVNRTVMRKAPPGVRMNDCTQGPPVAAKQMKRIVDIVEAPSNLGLRAKEPGKEPGVKKLPAWLKTWGFYDSIRPRKIHSVLPAEYDGELDAASGVRNADKIARYAQQLAAVITPLVADNVFSVVIGGDCSVLIGPMLGLKSIGTYGLFFLDGHTDYAWPPMSQSGGAAGMDLAIVTGHGHDKLTNIDGLRPYVVEKNVWSVGNRDFDEAYLQAIHSSGIGYFDLPKVRQLGPETCVKEFLAMVQEQTLSGFWIHLDVDVLQDELMPAVDSRQRDGLTYGELTELLNGLLASEKAVGLDMTILDPELDPDGAITIQFINGLKPTFSTYLKNAP